MLFDYRQQGILKHMKKGSILIDHTTNTPSAAREFYRAAKDRGLYYIDAPVSGGKFGAQNGQLIAMLGGDSDPIERVQQIFSCYCANVQHMGPSGKGQQTKIANQIMQSGIVVGLCQGLVYGYKKGLNVYQMVDILEKGGAASGYLFIFFFNNTSSFLKMYGVYIINNQMNQTFIAHQFLKDLVIALEQSKRMELKLPGLALAHQMFRILKIMIQQEERGIFSIPALMRTIQKLSKQEYLI